MKHAILIAVTIFLLTPAVSGQEEDLPKQRMNGIKTDLFSPFLRTGVLKYERVLTDYLGLQLGFFYTGYSPRGTEEYLSGWGITPEIRLYLSETQAPAGTYLAPSLRYMKLDVYDEFGLMAGTLTSVSAGVNLGKQTMFRDMFLLDAWVGPTWAWREASDSAGNVEVGIPEGSGFGLRLGLAIGFAF